MDAYFLTYLVYPDTSPVKFLLYMLGVIALALWIGMKEDK